jgi:hypothetical protein
MLGQKEHTLTKPIVVALAGAVAAITARPAYLASAQKPVSASIITTAGTPGHTVAPSYPAFRIEDALSR